MRAFHIASTSVLLALAGCPSTPEPTPDAAPMMDARVVPDAAVLGTCGGMAMPCEMRPLASCTVGGGCMAAACVGTPAACATFTTSAMCRTQSGCAWTGTSCFGEPAPCTQSSESVCTMRMGCRWDPTAATECSGTPTDCSMVAPGLCMSVPGCMLDAPDAGPVRDAPRPPRDAPRMGSAVVTVTGGNAYANCFPVTEDPVVAFWNVEVTGATGTTATLVSATLNIASPSGSSLMQTLVVDHPTVDLVGGRGMIAMRKTSGMPAMIRACDAAYCNASGTMPSNASVDLVFMVDGDQIEASYTVEYLCAE